MNISADRTTRFVSALTNTAKGYSEQLNYSYTKNGEIYTVGKGNIIVERYKYDTLGRLIREDNRAFNKTVVYAYDIFGNITSKTVSTFTLSDTTPIGTVKTYGYADGGIRGRLTSYDGKSLTAYISKPYSDNGYPQVYFKHGSTDYWKMQWSGSSLKSMRLCNSVGTEKADSIEYLYNCSGVRIRKTVNGIDTDYIYVGSRLLREVKTENTINYMYGSEGIIGFEIASNNGSAERYYYIKNIQGDITHIVDNNGIVVVKYVYDAWGNCKVYDPDGTENGDDDFIGNINPIRYRGYYYDVETKLYYLLSRYYDPEVGRFISPDSVEYIEPETLGGLNLYSYCNNNPVMHVDPSGHFFGYILQFIFSVFMYIGFAIAAVFDESIRNDMNAIGWNPFNTDENAVIRSNKVSFYKGAPVFRMQRDDGRSGTFLGIFLDISVQKGDIVRHEWGHILQQMILGPVAFGLTVGIQSPLELGNWSNYYDAPWETIADIFGGVQTRVHSKNAVNRAWYYLLMGMFFPPATFLFLL